MRKDFLIIILSFGVSNYLWAQNKNSHFEPLPWVKEIFPPKMGDYDYMVARGSGSSLAEARENALNDLLVELGNNKGVTVNSNTIQEIKSQLNFDGKNTEYKEGTTTLSTFKIDREGFDAAFFKVGEYYERQSGGYELWALYEVSLTGKSFTPYIPQYTDKYGFAAAWRSAIVPGWGQFHKGKTGKGVLFLTTEIVTVSGVIFFETRRADNMRKSRETTNLSIVKQYRSRADNWEQYRNIAIGAAAGVYVWNVIDAALAKGKIRYAGIPRNMGLSCTQSGGYYYYGITFDF